MSLIEIKSEEYPILIDLKYGTSDNFTGQKIYDCPKLLLHKETLSHLEKSIELAAAHHLKIKIFDGFRPHTAQQKLWSICPHSAYVANPEKGSHHTRGIAVDLTLVDQSGKELDMGTSFDDFTSQSHHLGEISKEAQSNRYLLLSIMMIAGWDLYPYEWWHYQLSEVDSYPLILENYKIMAE